MNSLSSSRLNSNSDTTKRKVTKVPSLSSQKNYKKDDRYNTDDKEILVTESDDGFETETSETSETKKPLKYASPFKRMSSKGRETEEVKTLKEKCYKIERKLSSMTKEAKSLRGIADGALLERDELGSKLKSVLEQNDLNLEDGEVKVVDDDWEDGNFSDDSREYDYKRRSKTFTVYIAGGLVMVICCITMSLLCVLLL